MNGKEKGEEELTMDDRHESIEKIFSGLRNATPPEGLEDRILHTMQARASRRAQQNGSTPSLRTFFAVRRPALVLTMACALVMVLFVVRTILTRHVGSSSQPFVQQVDAKNPTSNAIVQAQQLALPTSMSREKHLKTEPGRATEVRAASMAQIAQDSSYPAPPMPLTEQEKLLVRLAHQRSPQSLAALSPAKQAKQEAIEVAQFEDFFKEQKIEVKNEPAEQR